MPLPRTITPSVSQDAIRRVGRLFDASLFTILGELFQNSRRAGAGHVHAKRIVVDGTPMLSIRDDGRGIDDPASLVTLGHSGWDTSIQQAEDPAGMGVFALAGYRVEIRSWSASARQGWRAVIEADAWDGSRPIAILPDPITLGTEILIALTPEQDRILDATIIGAARFYPLPVMWRGEQMRRVDFLKGAHHVETWRGARIGVFSDARLPRGEATINFHGIAIRCPLPAISEIDGPAWSVRVDIGRISPVLLVLPARREIVQDEAHDALRAACLAAIFHAVHAQGAHRLSHADWREAAALGIDLPEAARRLDAWDPPIADYREHFPGPPVHDGAMILMDEFPADIAWSAARALGDGEALGGRLVDAEPRLAGYGWYDALPRITDLRFTIRSGDAIHRHDEATPLPAMSSGYVDDIRLEPVFADGRPAPSLPVGVLIERDPDGCDDLADTTILLTRDAGMDVAGLADLLEKAAFCPSDDVAADSRETQLDDFRAEARGIAAELLLDDDQAVLLRIEDHLRKARWLLPEGRSVAIAFGRDHIELAFVAQPPAVPS
ncbi:ATP-binding protein [Sphingomonas oryzagri]